MPVSVPSDRAMADEAVAALRQFNRFYTRTIGALDEHLLKSPFSLTEARVLYELAHRDAPTAKDIGAALGLDAGYLSRIVQTFLDSRLITRTVSPDDRRQFRLALTAKGRTAFARLNAKSHDGAAVLLQTLPRTDATRLIAAMQTIEGLLDTERRRPAVGLRTHVPGDMGWVVAEHGRQYAEEFGWDISFEGMVAEIVAKFLADFDAVRERCWIADVDGRQAGSVFLVKQSDDVAKLRLLLVDPAARGLGVGKMLVDECIAFARASGYRKITLWTQSMLVAARGIYQRAGFVLAGREPHRSFGQDLVGETWELTL